MELKYEPNLDYQQRAIKSITNVFSGQETFQSTFSVAPINSGPLKDMPGFKQNLGHGNMLILHDSDILKNIQKIQSQNGLAVSKSISSKDDFHLTVEMETGTGKTYVYLRTIFELNNLHGFTKFIIVVPSIAIKEGVEKTLQMTESHFKDLYENVNYDYFVYNSKEFSDIRNFATSPDIQIMVINIDSFRKSFTDTSKENSVNIIHRHHDRMSGAKPIEFLQQTNPIVIIDEPQSVDTTPKSKEAIASLNPLCTLRYSATHSDKHHMVFKLDSIDAYEQKLVKQIEVAGIEVKNWHNTPYIKLISVNNEKNPITARVEIECRMKDKSIKRKVITISGKSDLSEKEYSGGRDVYEGFIVDEIYCKKGSEFISFTNKSERLKIGQTIGGLDTDQYKRIQIRKTIEEHLDKELRLNPRNIKVLSLFFIDRVANYRWYDENGFPQKGKYANIFEEEYAKLIKKQKYKELINFENIENQAKIIHNGYFAIDNKKDSTGFEIFKDSTGISNADEKTYNLIMKNKEKLLSFDSNLKFIFSHSALREGWDNPNVFQICTLNETNAVNKKRQEIGRGLRIAVDQSGKRIFGFDVNTLTVIANESYEEFADKLQKEIEQEEGITFGYIEKNLFENVVALDENDDPISMSEELLNKLWKHLIELGHINENGVVLESLKDALESGTLKFPAELEIFTPQILNILKKISSETSLKNRDNRKNISINKGVYLSDDFKQLWDKIKYKTTFRVKFDVNELVAKCAKELYENIGSTKTTFTYRKAKTEIHKGGIEMKKVEESIGEFDPGTPKFPDIITHLQNETNLTRRTIVKILKNSKRLEFFKKNPQKFIENAESIIVEQMQLLLVDGIKYQKIGKDYYYCQKLFEENELFGYLKDNTTSCKKSVYHHIVYDSDLERNFAIACEQSNDIKLYVKLPSWFKIDTPLGSYNPDWAILVEEDGRETPYFVLETKSTLSKLNLRLLESSKIECGKEHFNTVNKDVRFLVTNSFEDFSSKFA